MSRSRIFVMALSLATIVSCDSTPSSPDVDPSFAKGGGGAIKVDATDPTSAPQDTTVDIRVIGSGFEPGANVRFLLAGASTPKVVTNRTRFVSETEVVAEVSITFDADVALYDVEVSSRKGRRRGVGTELFSVVEKTNGGGPAEGNVVTTFSDFAGAGVTGDGQGSYVPVTKRQSVRTEIRNGQHWLELGSRSRRALCWSFPPAGPDASIVSASDWADLVSASNGAVDLGRTYCGETTWHTRDHTDPGKLLDMDTDPTTLIDDVQAAGGKMMLLEFGGESSWEWRLFFDDGRTPVNGGEPRNGICIRKNGDGTWTLGTDPSIDDFTEDPTACDLVDGYLNLIRVQSGDGGADYTYVARFRMPFQVTLAPLF